MTLKEKLQEDLKTAMKSRDTLRLSVIRLAKTAIMNLEIKLKTPLDDAGVIEVLAKEVKQRRDSIPEYEKAGRADFVQGLQAEIAILEEYLPAQLSEVEIRQLVQAAIQSTGATSRREMGKVMAVLMPQVKGKADGKMVNTIVSSILGE